MNSTTTLRRLVAATAIGAVAATTAACGSTTTHGDNNHAATSTPMDMPSATATSTGAMPGMTMGAVPGDGLKDSVDGYRLTSNARTLPAGRPTPYTFTIRGTNGTPVTAFATEQTKRLHFYVIRTDLTGFQHVHPTMATDGTWTAPLAALAPGTWRLYASFVPAAASDSGASLVLSRTVTVAGRAHDRALPDVSDTTTVDGYQIRFGKTPTIGQGRLTAAITKDGRRVKDLRPYLGVLAHMTAFHHGDLAYGHLHPEDPRMKAKDELTFHTEFDHTGLWRLFLQFQTGSGLHTAALTVKVT